MKRISFLAGQLDAEISDTEKQVTQKIFTESIEFWQLCLECKRILLEEKQLKWEKKNEKNRFKRNSQVAD